MSSNLKMDRNFLARDKITEKRVSIIILKRIVRYTSHFRF